MRNYILKLNIVVKKLFNTRKRASVNIQKIAKGFLVRKDLPFMKSKKFNKLIRWRYPAKEVFLLSNLTYPP